MSIFQKPEPKPARDSHESSACIKVREPAAKLHRACCRGCESGGVCDDDRQIGLRSGAPLERGVRSRMERAFGVSFQNVRVHVDDDAARAASRLNSKAFTVGTEIYFNPAFYQPGTTDGARLIAHELTHTLQQRSGTVASRARLDVSSPYDAAEQEADAVAARVAAGQAAGTQPAHSHTRIQRQATQPPPDATVMQRFHSQIRMLKRAFGEKRYGCFCGPGHVCETPHDAIDQCCKEHDEAYDRAGVSSTPGPGQVNMWSAEGFVRTMGADLALVGCTAATMYDLHIYGPAAAAYRASVAVIFGSRAAIATALVPYVAINRGAAALETGVRSLYGVP